MTKAIKEITIGDKKLTLIQLEPWHRLAFIADLQKEFLTPLLKNTGTNDLNSLFSCGENDEFDVMTLISAFSSSLDGQRIEKWTRRILMEGMVVYTRQDEQLAKLSFGELNKFFTHPAHIILLLKEVIAWNLADFNELMGSFMPKTEAKIKETPLNKNVDA
ncbi:hypothetical protein HWQ17_23115 (plasmid) [Enterobacter pasteurii]|uniref:phage tail assembly chaperone n=1 Tax=Enterobacter pasteurii TaxID=3029761 RepID=UPI0011DE1E4B|nr:hypothetical protein [Enterobacter pasteurii]ELK6541611.1 hypothetical protein [Enterobacter bugandensis]QLA70523.1 hypothetical protein HWQ17_23115 [Enterobacter pasteurii]